MSLNWQNLNKPGSLNSGLADAPHGESVLRVIKVLQKAGFCVYPSDSGGDNIIFIAPVATESWFPQDFYSNN